MDAEVLLFYRAPGPMTALPPGETLPGTPGRARAVVQGLLVHSFWLQSYGLGPDLARPAEQQLRRVSDVLGRSSELSPAPLGVPRPPAQRVQCVCRHFAVLYTGLLRAGGVPARARCGFASYFEPGHWEDHWITEWWDGSRWVRDDPQLDDVQRAALGSDLNPHDLPAGAFLTGAEAWREVRAGRVDAADCGIGEMQGAWFVAGNLIRDLASLNNAEMLPWDSWGAMPGPGDPIDAPWFDGLARLVVADNLSDLRDRYLADAGVHVPKRVTSFVDGRDVEVSVPL